jgi:hypothetical protein
LHYREHPYSRAYLREDALMNPPEQFWQAVLDHLRTEMDPASFEAWVKPAQFVSLSDNTLTIGAPSKFARDWLSDRLESTIRRQLAGLMGQEIAVRFIVLTQSAAPKQEPINVPDEQMQISIRRGLLEAYTKPDTALYFPGYWLRWVPYIGAKPFATILAFRQALYMAEAEKNGRGDFKENTYFAVSAEKVGRIIGVTAKTIRRQRDGYKTSGGKFVPPQLDWFLSVQKTNKVNYSSATNQFAREAHRYAFKQSPITPGDIDAIIEWLLEHGLEHTPLKALEEALEAQPREIISFPLPKPTKLQLKSKPGSARADLVANILSYCSQTLDAEGRKKIIALSEKLRSRILASDGQVKVPLYFLKNILPIIGAPAAILITYLRKRAYRNTATGEIREEVTLEGGIDELATLLGVRPSAVYYHLPINADQPEEDRELQISRLIYAVENESNRLCVKVSTSDILIPEHREEYERAITLAEALLRQSDQKEIESVFELLGQDHNQEPESEDDLKNVHIDDSNFVHIGDSENVQMDHLDFVHIERSKNVPISVSKNVQLVLSEWFEKCPDSKYFKFLSLEILKDLILDLSTNLNTLTTPARSEQSPTQEKVTWSKSVGKEWELEKLFTSCRIDQETRKAILENDVSGNAFVSHMLYAFSPEGASLNHPVRFAIKQVLRPGDGDLGHGPRHDRLADLGPAGIQALIRGTEIFAGYSFDIARGVTGAQDWKRIMGEHQSLSPIIELGELLGLLKISY